MAEAKNKFEKNLSQAHKDIIGKRAKLFSQSAQDAQEDLVRDLQRRKRELETKLMNLDDLSPDSTMSLKVTRDGFDATVWVKEVQDTKVKLSILNVELEVAVATQKEYFEV